MTLQDAMTQVSRFTTLAMAHSAANRSCINTRIMLGDAGQFWVCSFRIAAWLVNHGYSYAY